MVFEFVCYAVAIVSVLAVVGSHKPGKTSVAPAVAAEVKAAVEAVEAVATKVEKLAESVEFLAKELNREVPNLFVAEGVAMPEAVEAVVVKEIAPIEPALEVVVFETTVNVPSTEERRAELKALGRDRLRQACKAAGIRYANAGPGGKHLTCAEMIEKLLELEAVAA